MPFRWIGPLLVASLAACASIPAERGDALVRAQLRAAGAPDLPIAATERASARAIVLERLAQPIGVNDAVAIAVVRNASLHAELARLGLAYADLIEASRPRNPVLAASALRSDEDGARTRIDLGLAQSVGDVLLLGPRARLARGELERAQQAAVRRVQSFIADVSSSYFALVGARQVLDMRTLAARASAASAELAARFHAAGNIDDLALAQYRAAAAEAALEVAEAKAQASKAWFALNAQMGLSASEAAWRVRGSLPLPVAQEDERDALIAAAASARLDLAAARSQAEALARSLGVTRRFRWLGVVEVGVEAERETDGARLIGPSVALELPLFHRNRGALERASANLERAEAEALALESGIGNQVAAAHARVIAARESAELLRTQLVPQREQIVARQQERVNFMLAGVFELLEAKREEYDAYQRYLEALRDYWVARAELAGSVGAALPSDATLGTDTIEPARLPDAPAPAHQHSGEAP